MSVAALRTPLSACGRQASLNWNITLLHLGAQGHAQGQALIPLKTPKTASIVMSHCFLRGHQAFCRMEAYALKVASERLRRQMTLLRWGP